VSATTTHKARILVVDDERSMQEFLEIFLRREGCDVATTGDVDAAVALLESDDFDVVISDLQMPGKTGLDLLRAMRQLAPETLAIVITAYATTETAIAAMKEGAYDYVLKPFQVDEIRLVLEKALEKKLLDRENKRLRSELRSRVRSRALIGSSVAMQRVYELVAQVAETKTYVLIYGESGTGKELVARAVHEASDRRDRPFVAVNCGAIPENLLESELFGHVKGAFTGAVSNKDGLFETADGGTLFLDEIGELPQGLQVKLLRVLQEKTIRRVGGTSDRPVDVRIVAATNRRLEEEVEKGRFREDLYYRLNVIQIVLPPLRQRLEDVPLLVHHFVEKYARELGRPIEGASEQAMRHLLEYAYPGNVRELENVIERAVALSRGPWIEPEALPPTVLGQGDGPPTKGVALPSDGATLDDLVNDFERNLLLEALRRAGGIKKRAAKLLGVSFRSFRYRLQKLGLDDPSGEEQ
jgi:two-component system response regulator PilR (NtrC family)